MVANAPDKSGSNQERRNADGTWPKGVSGNPTGAGAGRPLGAKSRTKAVEEAVCALAGMPHTLEGLAEGVKKFPMELLAGLFGRTLTQHVEADINDARTCAPEELDAADTRWIDRVAAMRENGHVG